MKRIAWLLLAAALWSSSAQADIVTLKNGARFRGLVTADVSDSVTIQSEGAVWSFHRAQIAKVELEARGRTEEKERSARRAVVSLARTRAVDRQDRSAEAPRSQVVVYGTSWCGYCQRAREYFTSHRIPYVDKDVERDPQARQEIISKCLASGAPFRGSVPVLDVYGQIIRGFSVPSIEQALQRQQTD